MDPEERARRNIDRLLEAAGWTVQDYRDLSLGAGLGVVVRSFPLKTGEADYVVFVDRKAVGVIEAKPEGTTLSGVSEQTEKYLWGLPDSIPSVGKPLRFAYENTCIETFLMDMDVPDSRSVAPAGLADRATLSHKGQFLSALVSCE
jgi:type I restriction enzyme R subunit